MDEWVGVAGAAAFWMFFIGAFVSLAVTALVVWIGYLIIRTAVKNGTLLAHEELGRREALRAQNASALRNADPDWR